MRDSQKMFSFVNEINEEIDKNEDSPIRILDNNTNLNE